MSSLLRVLFCIFVGGATLYVYIGRLNEITKLRLEIPPLERELKILVEENRSLGVEIDRFENPVHLMELLRKPEFGHLRHPSIDEVTVIR